MRSLLLASLLLGCGSAQPIVQQQPTDPKVRGELYAFGGFGGALVDSPRVGDSGRLTAATQWVADRAQAVKLRQVELVRVPVVSAGAGLTRLGLDPDAGGAEVTLTLAAEALEPAVMEVALASFLRSADVEEAASGEDAEDTEDEVAAEEAEDAEEDDAEEDDAEAPRTAVVTGYFQTLEGGGLGIAVLGIRQPVDPRDSLLQVIATEPIARELLLKTE